MFKWLNMSQMTKFQKNNSLYCLGPPGFSLGSLWVLLEGFLVVDGGGGWLLGILFFFLTQKFCKIYIFTRARQDPS